LGKKARKDIQTAKTGVYDMTSVSSTRFRQGNESGGRCTRICNRRDAVNEV